VAGDKTTKPKQGRKAALMSLCEITPLGELLIALLLCHLLIKHF